MKIRTRGRSEARDVQFDLGSRIPGATGQVPVSYYFEPDATAGGPEAYLVELAPNMTTGTHFHEVDQWQVFFPSDGASYQRQDIDSIMLHYTDAFTPYGPFSSGGRDSLQFFTLRAKGSSMHAPMPEERAQLVSRDADRRRHRIFRLYGDVLWSGSQADALVSEICKEADGLEAQIVRLLPGTGVRLLCPPGQFCLVGLAGQAEVNGDIVQEMGIGWGSARRERGRGSLVLQADDHSATMMLLGFPEEQAGGGD